MLTNLYLQILDMSKAAAIVIVAVLVARLLLKRVPKAFSYALWLVVLLRLICPFSFEAPLSAMPEMNSVSQSYTLSEESISISGASEAAYKAVGEAITGNTGMQQIRTTEIDEEGLAKYVTTDTKSIFIAFSKYVWLVGIGVMLLYSIISYSKLRKHLKIAVHLRDNIYIADDIKSPFVIGLISPKIYIPCNLDEKEMEYIILHEQHHIKRSDHIIKAISFCALTIHWFNPLVWVAFVMSGRDMEMSCDEAVIRKLGGKIRADYSASLLTLATGRRIISGTYLAFGEGNTKGRIKNISKWKTPSVLAVTLAMALCIILAAVLLTNPLHSDEADQNELSASILNDEIELTAYNPEKDIPEIVNSLISQGDSVISNTFILNFDSQKAYFQKDYYLQKNMVDNGEEYIEYQILDEASSYLAFDYKGRSLYQLSQKPDDYTKVSINRKAQIIPEELLSYDADKIYAEGNMIVDTAGDSTNEISSVYGKRYDYVDKSFAVIGVTFGDINPPYTQRNNYVLTGNSGCKLSEMKVLDGWNSVLMVGGVYDDGIYKGEKGYFICSRGGGQRFSTTLSYVYYLDEKDNLSLLNDRFNEFNFMRGFGYSDGKLYCWMQEYSDIQSLYGTMHVNQEIDGLYAMSESDFSLEKLAPYYYEDSDTYFTTFGGDFFMGADGRAYLVSNTNGNSYLVDLISGESFSL